MSAYVNLFAGRLANLRRERNLTQQQFAEQLSDYLGNTSREKISYITISSYERGNRMPIISTLISIAAFFNVTTDYLLGLDTLPKYQNVPAADDDSERPFTKPDIRIDNKELKKFNNEPIYVVFAPDKHYKPCWGILDYDNRRIILKEGYISIDATMTFYSHTPIEYSYTNIAYKAPLTIGQLDKYDSVWVELINADEFVAGQYNGWYSHNEGHTCLINRSNGFVLPYYGCGLSFNAYSL